MIEIHEQDPSLAEALQRAASLINVNGDFVIVDLHFGGEKRGLELALAKAKAGHKVICFGFEDPASAYLADDPRFQALVATANAVYHHCGLLGPKELQAAVNQMTA